MVVCAHGDVAGFCEAHEMQILESHIGNLEDYHKSNCAVIVTDQAMTRQEYDSLKCKLFGHGIELVSVFWTDDEVILRLLHNQIDNRKKRGGRQVFGFTKKNGQVVEIPEMMVVARRVIELRDAGYTLKAICADRKVRHPDGKKISVSTIQQIIKNRDKYERK
jgi:hypothetical protein